MASDKVPPYAQAVIEKCTLCDRGVDARFFCTNCNEEMCKQCQTTHLRSRVSCNHNVISIADDKDTSTCDAKINCTIHKQETVQMYCNDCEALVCLTCIAGTHKNHAFDKLVDATDKYRKKISGHASHLKQKIQGLKTNLQSLEGNKKAYIKDTDAAVDNINKKLEEWKSQAHTIANSLIQQVQDYKQQDIQHIDEQCKQIQDLISENENMLRTCEGVHQSANLESIIKYATDIQKADKANPLPVYASSPRFNTEGMVDLTEIFCHLKIDKENAQQSTSKPQDVNVMKRVSSKSAGTSSTIDNTVVAEFKTKQKVSCVSVIGEKHAWIDEYAGKNVTLVDIGGNVTNKLPLGIIVYDIKATTQNEVFITECNGHQIQKYNTDGKCVTIADMSPFKTRGLCIASDDELLVCSAFKEASGNNDNKVVRMTKNGQVKQTIQYDQHKQPLYREPRLVTENINGDVCVVDGLRTSIVVVVNKQGILRLRYPNTADSSNTIEGCLGIACDKLGFILISDFTKHQIHQIDTDGQFIQFILSQQHGINCPMGLDVDTEGKLWICDNNGCKVSVVKYRS